MGFLNRTAALLGAGALLLGAAACGGGALPAAAADGAATELRLGYFANVTHAGAVYGVAKGLFAHELGRSTRLETNVFNAGPAAVEALRGGSLDAAFLGPNPAINGFTQTRGTLLRIVAGTTSGGASLVVQPTVTDAAQLAGKTIATPQLGNTQDVAAKAYFRSRGVDVKVLNQDNSQTFETFKAGKIEGAWVPEPWASRLVLDGGGRVLVDERTRWPGGRFVTTHLVVTQKFLTAYPKTVEALLRGLLEATDAVATRSQAVQDVVNAQIKADTGTALAPAVLQAAFRHLTPTVDPVAGSLRVSADNAVTVGVSRKADLDGIYDLSLLNALLTAAGRPPVDDAGLGASS